MTPPPSPGKPPADDIVAAAEAQMLAVNARRVIVVGIALFFVAFVVLLPFWSWLGEHDHRVWLWTALAGWVLGALALPLVRKHSGEGRLG
jgi:hypothetical protein